MSTSPGPWTWIDSKLVHRDTGKGDGSYPPVIDGPVLHLGDECWPPSEEDARLIAAAPELLAALKKMISEYIHLTENHYGESRPEQTHEACRLIARIDPL
jgi:hypothetical protein